MPGPPCGNNPHHELTPGDAAVVADFQAYLAARAEEKKTVNDLQNARAALRPFEIISGFVDDLRRFEAAVRANERAGTEVRRLGASDADAAARTAPGVIRRRKKPVEVDTIQWTGTNEADVQAFTDGASVFYAIDAADREGTDDPEATATVYDRLHSTWVLVYTGQHIVRGVKGEFYPIAEDVLAETYEPVSAPS